MNPDLAQSPLQYASAIARYISDPSTIRARTIDSWGRAPSVEQCRNLRVAAVNERNEFSRYWEARATEQKDRYTPENFPCGHDRSMENTWHKGDREECRACIDEKRDALMRRLKVQQMVLAPSEPKPDKSARPEDTISSSLAPSRRALALASRLFDLPIDTITSTSRKKSVVRARWSVMHALRFKMNWSLDRIAGFLGLIDHTTIRYAIREANALIERDEWFAEVCQRVAAITVAEMPKVSGEVVDLLTREAA